MPIERYKGVDPFENHPLFKTEEQARIEDTLDGNVSIAEPEEDLVVAHAQAYGIEPTHGRGPLEPLPGLRLGRLATGLLGQPGRLRGAGRGVPRGSSRLPALRFEPMTHRTASPPLESYARLAVEVGLNLQPGQDVLIIADVEHAELTRAVTRAAYEAGARYVDVEVRRRAPDAHPRRPLARRRARLVAAVRVKQIEDLGERRGAVVQISGAPDPAIFAGVDGERLSRNTAVDVRRTYLEQVNEGRFNWVIVAGPTARVGRARVRRAGRRPAVGGDRRAVRLDEPDPPHAWRDHIARLQGARRRADGARVRRRPPPRPRDRPPSRPAGRRDLGMRHDEDGLGPAASSRTCRPRRSSRRRTLRGPTGTVRSTKPLVLLGQLVRDIEMRFEGGRAVDVRAARGRGPAAREHGDRRQRVAPRRGRARRRRLARRPDGDHLLQHALRRERRLSHRLRRGPARRAPGRPRLSWEEREAAGINHSARPRRLHGREPRGRRRRHRARRHRRADHARRRLGPP